MGKVQCKIVNDTDYNLKIEDYDGNHYLRPHESMTQWLVKDGPWYITLVMKFPDGNETRVLRNSEYNNQSHYMSNFFSHKIRELQQLKEEEMRGLKAAEEEDRRWREEQARKQREEEDRRWRAGDYEQSKSYVNVLSKNIVSSSANKDI